MLYCYANVLHITLDLKKIVVEDRDTFELIIPYK